MATAAGPMPNSFYFGCWKSAGHFLHYENGQHVYERDEAFPKDFPVTVHTLDGGLLGYPEQEIEGKAVLSHIGDWTVISFWDRSVDSRGKSNSSFVMRGKWDFSTALGIAKSSFPSVFSRFGFEVVLAVGGK